MLPVQVFRGPRQSLGYQRMDDVMAVATYLAPRGAISVILQAEDQNVRWRDDGVAPTATVGMLLRITDPPFEYFGNLSALQVIRTAPGAILNLIYRGPEITS